MKILGNVCTLFVCGLYCLGRFQKSKNAILFMDILAKIMTLLMFFFFQQSTGVGSELLGLFVLLSASLKEKHSADKHSEKIYKIWYFVFFSMYTIILLLTNAGVSSFLIYAVSVISLTSNWWFSPQMMRLADMVICLLMFAINMTVGNYAGFTELITLSCDIVSYRKYRQQEKKDMINIFTEIKEL